MAPAFEEYPRDLTELESGYGTDGACRAYLARLRWPDGFRCPRCASSRAWPVGNLWECRDCGHQTSVTAGTIFQDTRTPLPVWFRAMWWLTTQKNGASALGLQRVLGLKSYETAWAWLHKMRRAMVRPGRDRLVGRVEIDEAYIGGLEEGKPGRGSEAKALIVVAAGEDGRGIGRIRMKRIPDASAASLEPFIADVVEEGSTIHTDAWRSYLGVAAGGYRHEVSNIKRSGADAAALLPRVHRVISLLKRWLLGTHQGAPGLKHLDYYLDEFTFRFNRRHSKSRGKLFYRLVQQAVSTGPTTYDQIVHGPQGPPPSGQPQRIVAT